MNYYRSEQEMTLYGVYKGFENGYFIFETESDGLIDFEEINPIILNNYNLKSSTFKEQKFEITYLEIIDDLDDEDFVVFKLENIKPI